MYEVLVPEGESVALPTFWIVEYYSPSHAEDLTRRIGSRKWRNADYTRPESAGDAVRRGRQHATGLGWQAIATLVSHESDGWIYPGAVRARLPAQFRSISIQLLPLGSALTAVVAQFTLTETAAKSVDAALRVPYLPELRRVKGRIQVRQRLFVAIEAVQSARERLHQAGRDWLARELPGLFAVEADAQHPALDLLITKRSDPFAVTWASMDEMNFQRAIGLDQSPFALIESTKWKRIRIMDYVRETDDRSRDSGLALVCRFDDALGRKNDFKYLGDKRTEGAIVASLGFEAPGLISRYGLFELLRVKQVATARSRDSASNLHSRRPIRSARKLRAAVLKSSIDMASVARDIQALAASSYRYEWSVPALTTRRRVGDGWAKRQPALLRAWARNQKQDANRLAELDRELLSSLGLASSLNASIEGIRSQRWSLVVALLSLISSGVAVWFAYLAIAASAATSN